MSIIYIMLNIKYILIIPKCKLLNIHSIIFFNFNLFVYLKLSSTFVVYYFTGTLKRIDKD